VDVHQLRCFLAVAAEGHFGRGAERLHLTTSPVSRAIRDLEREVGAPLFVRGHHHLSLTAAGERLVERGAPLLTGFEALLPELRSVVDAARSLVRLGSTHLTEPEVVDEVAECAARAWPAREVTVELRTGENLMSMLELGALDAVVDYLPLARSGVRSRALVRYQMGLAMRADDALARHASLTLADVADRTIVLLTPDPQPAAVTGVRRQLEERGVRNIRMFTVTDVMHLAEHVRRTGDLSLSFVDVRSGATRAFHDPAFTVLPVTDGPDLALGVAWRVDREDDEPVGALLAAVSARWPGADPGE
jgi:DNA-binding transcriptional LysR family regulator